MSDLRGMPALPDRWVRYPKRPLSATRVVRRPSRSKSPCQEQTAAPAWIRKPGFRSVRFHGSDTPAADDLQHAGVSVDLIVPLCRHCDSDPIALLAGSAIVS